MDTFDSQLAAPIYQILFESIEEGFLVVNKKGIIVLANPRLHELFRYEDKEIIGLTIEDLIPKDIKAKHVKLRENFHSSPKKRSMGEGMNLKALRKDNTKFYVEISLNHVDINDETFVSALVTDISTRVQHEKEIIGLNKNLELKVEERTKQVEKSQELYSAIARNFPNGTINVFDKDLNYIFVDGKELFQLGIKSEKLIGTNYLDKISSEIRPKIKESLLSVFEGHPKEFEIVYKNEFYKISAVPLKDSDANVDRILVVEQNISAQKRISIQQSEALEKEKELNEMKSRFVSMASHEFRTPLSTILSSNSLVEKYQEIGEMEKAKKHTERIKKSVRGLTEILNDFLSVDKLETQETPIKIIAFDFNEFLFEIVEEMSSIKNEEQTILIQIEDDFKEVKSDPNILKNICYNLLSNAIKYSLEDGEIIISAALRDGFLKIEVRDQGIGIPEEEQVQLFSRFFRASNAVNIKGTGLGLQIVSKYAHMLNGQITFESAENKGSTFTIKIPIQA
ncbi:sensor histidine kinase [Crocinitomix catalasitica]|uniref:sensor histidine kinase n=1 Tax=Crocinitomix catalasitica TaxID=184607 RepID=UPI00068420E9|nr:PAS domain-containing sensor histidine kinase [Crocinitomix catalasitica]